MINTNSKSWLPFGRDVSRKGGYKEYFTNLSNVIFLWLRGESMGIHFIILNRLHIIFSSCIFFPIYETFEIKKVKNR